MDLFDEARAYLDRLPHGTASHPECVVRAAVFESLRSELPALDLRQTSEALSPTLAAYLRNGPSDEWIPEVWTNALLEVWFVAIAARSEERFRERMRAVNRELFESPLYRAVTRVLSLSLVIMGLARSWGFSRRGTRATARMGPRHASPRAGHISVEHPAWVYGERQLIAFEEAFLAVGDIVKVSSGRVRRSTQGAEETTFTLEWMDG